VTSDVVYYSSAKARCQSKNADLVSISDEDENNFVTNIWSVN